MEIKVENEEYVAPQINQGKERKTHAIDIILWTLWAVLMWGFLITLAVIDSPANSPGIHELIITGYFLGFSIVFAIIYIMVLKRG